MSKIVLDAIRRSNHSGEIPIWFMRQAGRYLPKYMEIKQKHSSFMEMVLNPSTACEISLLPLNEFDLDAVIIFSDILVILHALGVDVTFKPNYGPLLSRVDNYEDFIKLTEDKDFTFQNKIKPVLDNIKLIKDNIKETKTIIGFTGGAFTLCCYLIDGGKSNDFPLTKKLINTDRELFKKIIHFITQYNKIFLSKQITSGVDVVKIFDSHSGILNSYDFNDFVVEPTINLVSFLKEKHNNIPVIGFPRGCGVKYIDYSIKTKVDSLTFDYTIPVDWIAGNFKESSVQGNLDPSNLAYDIDLSIYNSNIIINNLYSNGFVFNLGHGVIPETPVNNVHRIIEFIKSKKVHN